MALAVINDPAAQRGFEKDINLNKSNAGKSENANSGTNPTNSFNNNRGLGDN